MITAGFRAYAERNGCAPTGKTTDAEITAINDKVSRAFYRVAKASRIEVNYRILHRIALKFLNVRESFGETVFEEHLVYELAYLSSKGLRPEYKQELNLFECTAETEPEDDAVVTPGTVSKERLFSLFDEALMKPLWDKTGDVRLSDHGCYVLLLQDNEVIRLRVNFMFKDDATQTKRLECANSITKDYILARASSKSDGTLSIEYDISIRGGVTKENLIETAKRFVVVPIAAIKEFATGLVI